LIKTLFELELIMVYHDLEAILSDGHAINSAMSNYLKPTTSLATFYDPAVICSIQMRGLLLNSKRTSCRSHDH